MLIVDLAATQEVGSRRLAEYVIQSHSTSMLLLTFTLVVALAVIDMAGLKRLVEYKS